LKSFSELSEREILALAVSSEEEDSRIYMTFAEDLQGRYPASAKVFEEMAEEERSHRHMLLESYEQRFGKHLPPIRREDVKGFLRRRPIWLTKNLSLETIRKEAENMEFQAARFYVKAADHATDTGIRKLLGDLADAEQGHERLAAELERSLLTDEKRSEEERTSKRMFLLQYVQPGLAGLMDGSVSTLAPLFAAAFATRTNHQTFLVGLAAAIGAGISMGFAEALSDDGSLTGRGSPWLRGGICGLMTAVGGLGHSLPFLVPDRLAHSFEIATAIAAFVVFLELWAIAWVRAKYMDTPFLQAVFQIVLGGVIVLGAGILIGGA
jgi:erythrin-vacuolar iron transport family protein